MKKLIILLLVALMFSCTVKKKNTGYRIHGTSYPLECGHCGKYFYTNREHKEFEMAPKKDWMFDTFEGDSSNHKLFEVLKNKN
jgi:hypothetical protein